MSQQQSKGPQSSTCLCSGPGPCLVVWHLQCPMESSCAAFPLYNEDGNYKFRQHTDIHF